MAQFSRCSVALVLAVTMAQASSAAPAPKKVPKELLEKRVAAAKAVYEENLARVRGAQGLPSELFLWSERWLEAELALAGQKGDRVKALQNHLDRVRDVERILMNFAKTGQGRQADAAAATYFRLEAEIRVLNEGVELDLPTGAKGKK